jgi:oxygen-independent coproporphyrinogen-3 oxidase
MLYLHIPFCQRKCPYCDFNTYPGLNRFFEPFAAAMVREIRLAGAARGRPPVKTIFLGGGTPTVLPARLLEEVLTACRQSFDVAPGAEITCEANPGTVDAARFAALRSMGVNRLSMGVQSFDDAELQFLGRIHSAGEAEAAFEAARTAGFDNVNLDMIFGLPGQSPETWQRSLRRALALEPEHLSLYSLTVEEGTPFADWARAGRIGYPDSDLAADLYELADEMLEPAGFVQYEISNWARGAVSSGQWTVNSCRHNLIYWRNEDYLGFGPGAHSSEGGWRWANGKPVAEYIARVDAAFSGSRPRDGRDGGWVDFAEAIDERTAIGETMMLGLRLVQEGVAYDRFEQRHGLSLRDFFSDEIRELVALGLLEDLPDRLRLTRRARLVGNQVFTRFIA